MSTTTEFVSVAKPADGMVISVPILVLHAHARCNCRCVMCDIWKRTNDVELRRHDLEPHRASLRKLGVQWVVLSGGEPLLNQDLRSLCEFFCEENIRLTLLTSGLLLHRRARDVVDCFDDVIISLDGPAAVHDRIRGINGAFRKIAEGVTEIRQLAPRIPISARCTLQKANHHCVQETVKSARALNLNSISFLAVDLTSEAFNRLPVWPSERQSSVALTRDELVKFEDEVEVLISNHAADIDAGFIAESPAKLRSIVNHFRSHISKTLPESPMCNAPWVSAVIEVDGTVRPCFFHQPIGNIRQETLETVLNSPTARRFRQELSVPTNPICQRCVCSLHYKVSTE